MEDLGAESGSRGLRRVSGGQFEDKREEAEFKGGGDGAEEVKGDGV